MSRWTRSSCASLLFGLVACDPTDETSNPSRADAQPCNDFELDVERYWSRETKVSVRAGILEADASVGKVIAERVVTRMDAVTQDWVMMQQKVCKDTVVYEVMPVEVYNKVSACLLANLAQQRQVIVVASSPRSEQLDLLETAIDAAGTDMRMCLDKAIYSFYEDGEDAREARAALAEAKVYRNVGDTEQANEAASRAAVEAEQSESIGLRVDSWVEQGWIQWVEANYPNARTLGESALAEARAGGYELGEAKASMLLGIVAEATAHHDEALEDYHRALAIYERVLGSEHPDTAVAYNNIAGVYHSKGEHDKALEYDQKALAIRERVLGPEHPATAVSYNNIGLAHTLRGEHDKALEYFQKALAIHERSLGTEPMSAAISYNNIAGVYSAKGAEDEALVYYQKALAIHERVLGPDHPDTAICYNNIGLSYKLEHEYDTALEYYRKALDIRERVLGTEHPSTAISYGNIGSLYFSKGEYAMALEYFRKALAIEERVFGPAHSSTQVTRNDIAALCKKYEPAC